MFYLLKIRTSIDTFRNEKCKVTFGLKYIIRSRKFYLVHITRRLYSIAPIAGCDIGVQLSALSFFLPLRLNPRGGRQTGIPVYKVLKGVS